MGDRTYVYDASNGLSDGAAAITASGYAQFAGADGVIDLGGNQSATVTLPSIANTATLYPQRARIDAVIPIWLTAIKTSSSNEVYKIMAVLSNDPNFAAYNISTNPLGGVEIGGMLEFGYGGSNDVPNGLTTPAPATIGGDMYELLLCTQQNNIHYQYLKLYLVLSGTTPSITFKAFLAQLMQI